MENYLAWFWCSGILNIGLFEMYYLEQTYRGYRVCGSEL